MPPQVDVGQLRELFERLAILLDPTVATPAHLEGLIFYSAADKAPSYYNDISGVTNNIGLEHWTRCINKSGATIAAGVAVYITGNDAATGLPTIDLAKADAEATSQAIGITTHSIGNNSEAVVTALGVVHELNTNAFNNGDILYLSPSVAGGFTTTPPSRPNFQVRLGVVTRKSATVGTILVVGSHTGPGDYLSARNARSSPARVVNTNYQPSTTRPVEVRIPVSLDINATVNLGTALAAMELRADPGAGTPTTVRDRKAIRIGAGLIGSAGNDDTLYYRLEPGWTYRIVPVTTNPTTGTSTAVINGGVPIEENIM